MANLLGDLFVSFPTFFSFKMAAAPRIQFTVTNVDYKRKDPVFWIEVQV